MQLVGLASSISDIASLIATRRYELGISSRDVDQICGLADGHLSKLECGTRRLGDVSLPALLSTLGLRIAIVADDDRLPARTREAIGSSSGRPRGPAPDEANKSPDEAA